MCAAHAQRGRLLQGSVRDFTGCVQQTPDVRAVLTAGLQAVVDAATTDVPRSVLTGRALRRFDVEAEEGTGDTERPGAVTDAPTAA